MSNHKEEYPALRKIFWEERAYNPGLLTAKLNGYGIDAHFNEVSHYWDKGTTFSRGERRTKVGVKVSDEERISTVPNIDDGMGGPFKPEEYAKLCEKSEQYFGRIRRIRPFSRVYTASPGKYRHENNAKYHDRVPLPLLRKDDWIEYPVCGVIRPSSSFVSPSNSSSLSRSSSVPVNNQHQLEVNLSSSHTFAEPRPRIGRMHKGSSRSKTLDVVTSPITAKYLHVKNTSLFASSESIRGHSSSNTQQRFDEYSSLILPLITDTEEEKWQPPVMKSKTPKMKLYERKCQDKMKEQQTVYTTGLNRVITLKIAENVAILVPREPSENFASSLGSQDVEYLRRKLKDEQLIRQIMSDSTEKSLQILTNLRKPLDSGEDSVNFEVPYKS